MRKLVKRVWNDFVALKEDPEFKNNSVIVDTMPILYFGDYEAYKRSSIKIVTVSLNPSLEEFLDKKRGVKNDFFRFPKASCLQGKKELSDTDVDVYISSLNDYFRNDPYNDWFNNQRKHIFHILNASYYNEAADVNTPLHIDIATPIATDPTWKKLNKKQKNAFLNTEKGTWGELIRILSPDIMIMSVDDKYIKEIDLKLYSGMEETTFKEMKYDKKLGKEVENERRGRFLINENYTINIENNSKKTIKVVDIVTVNKAFAFKVDGIGFGMFSKFIHKWKKETKQCQ